MDERLDQWIKPARPFGGFYEQAGKQTVEHPAITHDMEEAQEFGHRHGGRHMHPYWDVDLLEMLRRVRPEALISDGRAKALVPPVLARRLPGLGLESRVKVSAGNVFMGTGTGRASRMATDGRRANAGAHRSRRCGRYSIRRLAGRLAEAGLVAVVEVDVDDVWHS